MHANSTLRSRLHPRDGVRGPGDLWAQQNGAARNEKWRRRYPCTPPFHEAGRTGTLAAGCIGCSSPVCRTAAEKILAAGPGTGESHDRELGASTARGPSVAVQPRSLCRWGGIQHPWGASPSAFQALSQGRNVTKHHTAASSSTPPRSSARQARTNSPSREHFPLSLGRRGTPSASTDSSGCRGLCFSRR